MSSVPMAVLALAVAGAAAGHLTRRLGSWLSGVRLPGGFSPWPWPELLGAGALAWVAWRSAPAPAAHVLAVALVAVTVVDLRVKLIPDRVTFPGTLVGLVIAALFPRPLGALLGQGRLVALAGLDHPWLGGLALALAGAGLGLGGAEILRRLGSRIVGTDPMGMGDSKLLMMIGTFLGPLGLVLAIPPALLLALVFGLLWVWWAGSPPPFGPALAAGALTALLQPGDLLAAGRGLLGWVGGLPLWVVLVVYLVCLPVLVLLVRRVRRRAGELERQLEEEYRKLEER